jgi:hypothetical protein
MGTKIQTNARILMDWAQTTKTGYYHFDFNEKYQTMELLLTDIQRYGGEAEQLAKAVAGTMCEDKRHVADLSLRQAFALAQIVDEKGLSLEDYPTIIFKRINEYIDNEVQFY